MKVEFKNTTCIVTREKGDPKFYGIVNGSGESKLLHHVKLKLLEQGHKVIKKRMHKDGHMVDDMQQYIRTEKNYRPSFHIWNHLWYIRGAEVDYNNYSQVVLFMETDIWNEELIKVNKTRRDKLPLLVGTLTDQDALRRLEQRLIDGK